MPRLLIWNVENYGANRRRGWSRLRNSVLSLVLEHQAIDVFVIEEFKSGGRYELPTLRAMMGGGWYGDWLPGSLKSRPGAAGLRWRNLGFRSTGNSEGYAVLWHGVNRLQPFGNQQSYLSQSGGNASWPTPAGRNSWINLVTRGWEPESDPGWNTEIQAVTPHNVVQLGFPIPQCKQIGIEERITRFRRKRRLVNIDLNTITEELQVRRPCTVRIIRDDGTVVEVVVYHAPNGTYSSRYGALLCPLSQPLTAGGHAVAGGDFNVTGNQVHGAFANFTGLQNMVAATPPGAGGAYPRTMVRYWDHNGALITDAQANQRNRVLGSGRDQLFCRPGPVPANSGVLNLVDVLHNHADPLTQAILGSAAIERTVRNAVQRGHIDLVANGSNAGNQLVNSFAPPRAFANYRAIGIFLRTFVSDHLPLVIDV